MINLLLLLFSLLAAGEDNSCPTAPNDLSLSLLSSVINSSTATHEQFTKAISQWPADVEIWPYLQGPEAKKRFANYILQLDDTDKREYRSFTSLCTGFSSQLYLRYSSRAHLTEPELQWIKESGKVDVPPVPKKLKAPILMATYPGHYFNAFLINEKEPEKIDSYLVLEPQSDEIFTKGSEAYEHYVRKNPITFNDLVGFNKSGQYITKDVSTLLIDGAGVHRPIPQNAKNFVTSLSLSQTGKMNYDHRLAGKTFSEYMTTQGKRLSDEELLILARIVVGKKMQESPESTERPLEKTRYFQLIGRPDLEDRY